MSTVSVSYEEAPFGRLHWKVLLGGVFGQYSDGFMLGSIGIALSLATTELGLTPWMLGFIGAASLFGLMFGSLFAGPIVDRFGRQAIYQYTMLIFAAVSILQYFVSSANQLLALRLLLGLAIGADYAVGVTLVSEWTPLKQRARALGFMQAIWAAGYVSAYITGYFLQEAGWRWILLSCAVPSFISLFVRYGTPESPIWLMGKNRQADALKVIRTHLGEGYCIPPLPPLAQRLDTFCRLADSIGPERVVWRFDPLILGGGLSVPRLLDRIDALGRRLAPYTEKLVFSFLDMYRKTANALRRHDPSLRAPTPDEQRELAAGLRRLADGWPRRPQLASCAETIDLRALGIAHNACVDGELVRRLCPRDTEIQRLCGPPPAPVQGSLLPLADASARQDAAPPRDGSQRTACRCLPSRDIGAYSTCLHGCLYCYANQSEAVVRERLAHLAPGRELLA